MGMSPYNVLPSAALSTHPGQSRLSACVPTTIGGEVNLLFTGMGICCSLEENLLFTSRGGGVHWRRLCSSQGGGSGCHRGRLCCSQGGVGGVHWWRVCCSQGDFVVYRDGEVVFTGGDCCSQGGDSVHWGRPCCSHGRGVHRRDFVLHREGQGVFTGGNICYSLEEKLLLCETLILTWGVVVDREGWFSMGETLLFTGRGR